MCPCASKIVRDIERRNFGMRLAYRYMGHGPAFSPLTRRVIIGWVAVLNQIWVGVLNQMATVLCLLGKPVKVTSGA